MLMYFISLLGETTSLLLITIIITIITTTTCECNYLLNITVSAGKFKKLGYSRLHS